MGTIDIRLYISKAVFSMVIIYPLVASATLGQAGGDFEISRSRVSGGGGVSSGGAYTLMCTIGQAEAAKSSGGDYELTGGFLPGGPVCMINFEHFARFAEYWLQTNGDLPADLYTDGKVNFDDLLEFVDLWLCICPYDWPLR